MNTEPESQQPERNVQNDPDAPGGEELVAPGVPIVRGNTPRPLSFNQLASFPVEAPTAPPLPEESSERDENTDEQLDQTPLPLSGQTEAAEPEFSWLFEYGPDMDTAYLNSTERLAGAALLYGPGVLKGYTITCDVLNARGGQIVATIVPSRRRGDEVWGILYRVPSRTLRAQESALPLLDRIHSAAPPDGLFERIEVTIHEAYRTRDIACVTYIASTTARNEYHLLPRQHQEADSAYLQQLVEAARKQKLPESYVEELAFLAASQRDALRRGEGLPRPHDRTLSQWAGQSVAESDKAAPYTRAGQALAPTDDSEAFSRAGQALAPTKVGEQNTEPLPAVRPSASARAAVPTRQSGAAPPGRLRGSIVFSVYMACALAAALIAALIQGSTAGSGLLTASFIPPGVPWFILVYGFMGGCLSGIVTLGRYQAAFPPNFVLITWFTRPFIGAVLAVIAYLLLNSGLLALSGSAAQHNALFSLLAVLAGSCEGWLFRRRASS